MRTLILLFLTVALPVAAQPVTAVPWMTGERLLRMVTFPPSAKGNFDLARSQYLEAERARYYIEGVHDTTEGKSWCFNERYRPGPEALLDDIYAGLRKLSYAQQKRNAADLITEIWAKRWPCPNSRRSR